jgi:hypothetical protein
VIGVLTALGIVSTGVCGGALVLRDWPPGSDAPLWLFVGWVGSLFVAITCGITFAVRTW